MLRREGTRLRRCVQIRRLDGDQQAPASATAREGAAGRGVRVIARVDLATAPH